MTRITWVAVFALSMCSLWSAPASAQQPTSYTLRIYNAGAPAPLSAPTVIPVSALVCNLAQPAAAPVPAPNPTKVIFDDPANVGKACMWTDSGTGPLFSVPFGGSYEGTLAATNVAGTSAETSRVPFTRPGIGPGVPTGFRLTGS
jgi:hypothetical protein